MPTPRATLIEAARMFLNDVAEVSGYGATLNGTLRDVSAYVMRRPILTVPDPWFFAGLIALESVKICDLFPRRDAAILLREISAEVDAMTGRRGTVLSRLIFALMGRLGFGAVIMNMRVPDHQISDIILLLMGDRKTWNHLLPNATAHRQVRAALKTGAPSWWQEYCVTRSAKKKQDSRPEKDVSPAAIDEPFDLSTFTALVAIPAAAEAAHAD